MKSMDKKSPVADSPLVSGLEDNNEIDNKSIMKLLISMNTQMIESNDKTNRRIDKMNESINKLAALFR